MQIPSLTIKYEYQLETEIANITVVEIKFDAVLRGVENTILGIDPGTSKMGMAVIFDPEIHDRILLYEIDMTRGKTMPERMLQARNVLLTVARDCDLLSMDDKCEAIIEGAAFGKPFRQVELAEQRTSFALWLYDNGVKDIVIKQPNSVRLQAFGSAKIYAKELWPELPQNAAAALGCALSAVSRGE